MGELGTHRSGHNLAALLGAQLPLALRGARVGIARRAAVGLCLVVLIAVGVAVAFVVHGRATPAELTATSDFASDSGDSAKGGDSYGADASTAAPVAAASALPSPTTRQIVIDVEGKVRLPGVHSVASTARIQDALTAAGGALPGVDLTSLDLAERVSDGQQIRVGLPGAPVGVTAPDATVGMGGSVVASADPADPIDINEADATQLDALPGIGPALAARIIAWRAAHGDFETVRDLGQVPGLGGKKMTTLTPLVRV